VEKGISQNQFPFLKEALLLQAILFLENNPLSPAALVRLSTLPEEVVEQALATLKDLLRSYPSGIELIKDLDGYLLTPKKTLWPYLKAHYGKSYSNRLSKAELETLSVIAYSQPVTKSEIDGIRGLNSEAPLKRLLSRELIAEAGKKFTVGRPILYITTDLFLKLFRLQSIAELPKPDEQDSGRFELRQ
jgi:segregation and condensation protein B